VDKEITEYLRECAESSGENPDNILRRVLNLREPEFYVSLFPDADERFMDLFVSLDRAIKVRNPGVHYVRRTMFLGYRREGGPAVSSRGARSQIFLSVVLTHRRNELQVVLPISPDDFRKHEQVSYIGNIGHHGVGDLKYVIASTDDLATFLSLFDDWLAPAF